MSEFLKIPLKRVLREVNDPSPEGDEPLFMLSKARGLLPRDSAQGFSEVDSLVGYRRFAAGDLVMNKMQAWNGVFGTSSQSGLVSPDYAVFRLREPQRADIRFLTYLVKTPQLVGQFAGASRGMGTGFNRLHPEPFLAIEAALPPVSEQRRIADFLDDQAARIDSIVAARQQQIDDLALARLSSIDDALATAARSHGMRPLRRHLTRILTGSTPRDELTVQESGVAWYTPASMDESGQLGSPVRHVSDQGTRADGLVRFPPGSLLMVGIGATAGRVAIMEGQGAGNQQLTALATSEGLDIQFLFYQLLARRSALLGSAFFTTLPILNNETIRSFPVAVPDLPEQQRLVHAWRIEDHESRHLAQCMVDAVALLTEFKRSLISAAVAGEFDVTTGMGRSVPA